jgi:hypothetical protein
VAASDNGIEPALGDGASGVGHEADAQLALDGVHGDDSVRDGATQAFFGAATPAGGTLNFL